MAAEFDWKRFLVERGAEFAPSRDGFLADPEEGFDNLHLVPVAELAETKGLALLGEPGMGKSSILRRHERDLSAAGQNVLAIDLRRFTTDGHLVDALFGNAQFRNCEQTASVLYVLLDSLDECLLRIDNAAVVIADELSKRRPRPSLTEGEASKEFMPGLRLRIASRTARWPQLLEAELKRLFGAFAVYEVAPLRRVDVRAAALASGLSDPDKFVSSIVDRDLASLAIKPITARFLIETYQRNGSFPAGQIELYEQGCKMLCEEANESRRSAGQLGALNAEERLTLASRIAAITQISNRSAVYGGLQSKGVPPEDVTLDELGKGPDGVPRERIEEVLDTGLFSARGADRLGWAHQSYAEFLATRYLKEKDLPIQQTQALLFQPAIDGDRLNPQLQEVAAWLSAMDSRVLEKAAESDPETLLGAAAASFSSDQKGRIVESIFKQLSAGRNSLLDWRYLSRLGKLKHPGLGVQLRQYVVHPLKMLTATQMALRIARACGVVELGPEIAALALNPSVDKSIRSFSATVVAEVGSADVKARLKPLAFGESVPDLDDELKGASLAAIWPDSITAAELFGLLTPPRAQFVGQYSMFLYDRVISGLKIRDLPEALRWYAKQTSRQGKFGPIDSLMRGIIELGWDNIHEPQTLDALRDAVLSRYHLHDNLVDRSYQAHLGKKIYQDNERRRILLSALIPKLSRTGAFALGLRTPNLLTPQDFGWLLDRIESDEHADCRAVEAKMLALCAGQMSHNQMSRLWQLYQSDEAVHSEFGGIFAPIQLDSAEARQLREVYEAERAQQPKLLDPPPGERVEASIAAIEAGDAGRWVQLIRELTLESTSTHYDDDFSVNISETPGWKGAPGSRRERVVNAAFRFLREADPKNEEWFGGSTITRRAIAGFRAMTLVLVEGAEKLDQLQSNEWAKWVPILVGYPFIGPDEFPSKKLLLERACGIVPDEIISRLSALVEGANAANVGNVYIPIREIEICWSDRLGSILLERCKGPLKPLLLGGLLGLLLEHEFPGARQWAEAEIAEALSHGRRTPESVVAVSQALIANWNDRSWRTIWPIFQRREDIGKALVESASYADKKSWDFLSKLPETDLGDFYVWMVGHYPYRDVSLGPGIVGPMEEAEFLRNRILNELKGRATFSACDEIRRCMMALPEYRWISLELEEAESMARAAAWQPLAPVEFLKLVADANKRIVEDGSQLMQVIIESLDRLGVRLHDELPAVRDVWNTSRDDNRPKEEEDISDYIARHLKNDLVDRGIILSREVQIKRGPGGQRTDIHVDVSVPGANGARRRTISLIVEVKPIWNDELETAMETQLRGRYLKDNACNVGLYLVPWVDGAKWSDGDSRKPRRSKMTIAETRDFFEKQAAELSQGGFFIRSYVIDISL